MQFICLIILIYELTYMGSWFLIFLPFFLLIQLAILLYEYLFSKGNGDVCGGIQVSALLKLFSFQCVNFSTMADLGSTYEWGLLGINIHIVPSLALLPIPASLYGIYEWPHLSFCGLSLLSHVLSYLVPGLV